MGERLGYVEPRGMCGSWCIAWFIDGEIGTCIGEGYSASENEPDQRFCLSHWERWKIERAAIQFSEQPDIVSSVYAFKFETKAKARAAMAAIKLALTAKRPMNEHETWCLAQGWKPPKGWTGAT